MIITAAAKCNNYSSSKSPRLTLELSKTGLLSSCSASLNLRPGKRSFKTAMTVLLGTVSALEIRYLWPLALGVTAA